jgi:hypothetical protein
MSKQAQAHPARCVRSFASKILSSVPLLLLASCASCVSRDDVAAVLLATLLIGLLVLQACYGSGSAT